ncbi:hypothetical protein VP01_5549g1, partial [Puccinia sorghi]
ANNKNWYIFEPVELKSRHILVPISFFIELNQLQDRYVQANLFKDCPTQVIFSIHPDLCFNSKIPLPALGSSIETCFHLNITYRMVSQLTLVPLKQKKNESTNIYFSRNPWRTKVQGTLIRNFLIILYLENKSGNISNQSQRERLLELPGRCHKLCLL